MNNKYIIESPITYIDDLDVVWYLQIFGTTYEFYNYFLHLRKFGYNIKTCVPNCLLLVQYLCLFVLIDFCVVYSWQIFWLLTKKYKYHYKKLSINLINGVCFLLLGYLRFLMFVSSYISRYIFKYLRTEHLTFATLCSL